jgi:hypothetical protein
VEAIEEAETLDQLAALEAPVLGEQLMSDAMFELAEEAGAAAVAEAEAGRRTRPVRFRARR